MSAGTAAAQTAAVQAVPGWTQQGPARSFEPDNLFDYMDGNAEAYLVYRFVGMKGITCQSGDDTLNIDISEMENPEFAYGMFTATRDPRLPIEKIGMSGQVTPRKGFFVKDKYYVEISANPEKDHQRNAPGVPFRSSKRTSRGGPRCPTRSDGSRRKT